MENASKALIMAAGVLISIIVISAFVLMYGNLSSYQETQVQSTREAQILEFNNQYLTYNRNEVKGIDIYSLMNRVVDYNRRKSTAGTTTNEQGNEDEGQQVGYMPMTVKIDLKNNNNIKLLYYRTNSSNNSGEHLFRQNQTTYEASSTRNTYETMYQEVKNLESKYGVDSLNNLVTGLSGIFLDISDSQVRLSNGSYSPDVLKALDSFKASYKKATFTGATGTNKRVNDVTWDDLKEGTQIRKDVYKYYEYTQFKKAIFTCTDVFYDNNTGRILEMDFDFTGQFK